MDLTVNQNGYERIKNSTWFGENLLIINQMAKWTPFFSS